MPSRLAVPQAVGVDSVTALKHALPGRTAREGVVRHYRINKVAKPGGIVLKTKDVLAVSDKEAVQVAADSADCPVCEILKDGRQVGSIL